MNARGDQPAEGRRVVFSRVLDARRKDVFEAWTVEGRLARWWGPAGFTNPVCKIEPRSRGVIRIDMRAPDGVLYPMKGIVHEIVAPERLVFTSSAHEDESGRAQLEVLNTVTLEDFAGRTKLLLNVDVVHSTPAVARSLAGMEHGWSQSLDRLEALTREPLGLVARWRSWAPRLQDVLRMVAATLFMSAGTMKLFGVPAAPGGNTVKFFSELGLAGILETFGGAMLLLGVLTRPVAFILSGEMAVAYFQAHQPRAVWPTINGGLGAVLYCFLWLYISASGAGPWSLSSLWKHRKGKAKLPGAM